MAESTELAAADVENPIEKARRVVDSRLLTQDDFKRMEARQMSKQLSADKPASRLTAKRSRTDDNDDTPHQEFVIFSLRFDAVGWVAGRLCVCALFIYPHRHSRRAM